VVVMMMMMEVVAVAAVVVVVVVVVVDVGVADAVVVGVVKENDNVVGFVIR
jgi:hypothetical protein